jgi:hypothetical protein
MTSFHQKYYTKKDEKELMESTGYSSKEFKVSGVPKIKTDFSPDDMPFIKKYRSLHKKPLQLLKEAAPQKFTKLNSEPVLSRRKTTDILLTMNLMQKMGINPTTPRPSGILSPINSSSKNGNQTDRPTKNLPSFNTPREYKGTPGLKSPVVSNRKVSAPFLDRGSYTFESMTARSQETALEDTLDRIAKTITNFNPMSPSSLENRKDRVHGLVSKGVYRLYGMDVMNIGRVKNYLSTHEEKKNIPMPISTFRIRNLIPDPVPEAQESIDESDYALPREDFRNENPLFQFDEKLDGYNYQPIDNIYHELRLMSLRRDQNRTDNEINDQHDIRAHAEKLLGDKKYMMKPVKPIVPLIKKQTVIKINLDNLNQDIGKDAPFLDETDSVIRKSHDLEKMCHKFKSDSSKIRRKLRFNKKKVGKGYSALEKKIEEEKQLKALELDD